MMPGVKKSLNLQKKRGFFNRYNRDKVLKPHFPMQARRDSGPVGAAPKVAFPSDTTNPDRTRSPSGVGKQLDRHTALSDELLMLSSDTPNAKAAPSAPHGIEPPAKMICSLPFSSIGTPLFSEQGMPSQFSTEEVPDGTAVFDAVKSIATVDDLIPILSQLYEAHMKANKPVYLMPESETGEVQEAIRKLNALCGCVISWHLLVVKSCIVDMPKPTLNHMIGDAPLWVAKRVLCHFARLMKSQMVYRKPEERFALMNHISLILSPRECITCRDYPFIARMTVDASAGPFKRGAKVYMVVEVDNVIKIYNEKGSKCEEAALDEGGAYVDGKTAVCLKKKHARLLMTGEVNGKDWNHILGKTDGEPCADARLMGITFASLPSSKVPGFLGDNIAKIFMTLHQKPSRGFVTLTTEDHVAVPEQSLSYLANLFMFYGQDMRFLKMLVEYNLDKCRKTPSELFRENNLATLYLVNFLKKEMKEGFVHLTELFSVILAEPAFDYDHPTDEDVNTVERLFDYFWESMNKLAGKMTNNAKCLLSFVRTLSELTFVDEKLNHRGVVGLFFLRVIVPAFTAPATIGIDISVIPKTEVKKSLAFAKLVMSASTLDLSYSNIGERAKLNPVFEKNAPRVVAFLESVTTSSTPTFAVDGQVSAVQFGDALDYLTKFMRERRDLFEPLATGAEAPLYAREVVYQMYRDPEYYSV